MIDNTANRSPLPANARADFATRVAEADVLLDRPIFLTWFRRCSHRSILPHNEHSLRATNSRVVTWNMLNASVLCVVVTSGTTYAKQSARGEIEKR